MNDTDLHSRATVIDGLIVSNWSRSLFEAMREGGLTAANCTCSIWEGFVPSMREIARWKQWLRENDDILTQVYTVDDIPRAKREGKVGIILGWQNTSGFEDDLHLVPLFRELGLRVAQLTYHTANLSGSGCLEGVDRGLTDFGRDLIATLNEQRILIDLSHVGTQTSEQTIRASKQPVAYTHCAPKAIKDHPRNKTDADLRLIAERGGMVGVTMFPPFMRRGNDSTLDDYLDAIEHTVGVCGEDHVAIGTDFTQGHGSDFMHYVTHDKGYGRELLKVGEVVFPKAFGRIEQFPNLTRGMEQRKWTEPRIRKLLGENWLRMFGEVWGSA